jgi:hypothetical protein
MSDKLESSIRNDGVGHTMQTQDASNIQLSVLLGPVVGMDRNEVSRLSEPINDHLDGIILAGRERETDNEIHAAVFPFPCRNV